MHTENKKTTILHVDDDTFVLNMYSGKFAKHGLDVTLSHTSPGALKMIRGGFIPDILILDVVMPSMTGFELLEMLRAERIVDDSVVVMLTNQGQPEDIKRAQKLGVDGYIIKATATPSEVVEKVMGIYKNHKK